jgi:glycosyltransferase involved in cell wall biosynthesis
MRVLITAPSFEEIGGVANYFNILKNYFSADVAVEYFTVGSRAHGQGKWRAVKRLVKDSWDFYKALKSNYYDIIHLNPSLGFKAVIRDGILLMIAKASSKKVVVFFHGWDSNCRRVIRRYFSPFFKIVYSRADAFVVLASEFKTSLQSMGFRKPIYLITTAVADEIFHQADNDPSPQKGKELEGRFDILFLARVERAKGIYEALDAFKILKSKHPFVTLTIAGDGLEVADAKKYSQSHGMKDVNFLGYVIEQAKQNAFANADVYLFPSHSEGMPISVLEAMAFGLPVVTRPVGGIRDFFEDGRMGFVTESLEPEIFAKLVEKLLMDTSLRIEIADFNRQYAREHFTVSIAVGKIENIYKKIVNCTFQS